MSEYYRGAPNAFAGGMEYGATLRARRIRENALNALIQRYGPIAGDPATAAAMQGISERQASFPYEQAEAQRVDAARNAEVSELGVTAGDPQSYSRVSAEKLEAGRRAAAVLKQTKERGGDLGKAFDFVTTTLSRFGVPSEKLAEAREQILTNPDNVDELVAMLQDPNTVTRRSAMSGGQAFYDTEGKYGPKGRLVWGIPTSEGDVNVVRGLTPATAAQADVKIGQANTRIQQGWQKISQEQAKMEGFDAPPGFQIWKDEEGRNHAIPIEGTQQETDLEEKRLKLETSDRKFLGAANTVLANSEIVSREAERALPYFKGARAGIIMQTLRLGAKLLPGTDAYNANDAIAEIKNKVSIDALQQMRQSSPTGGAMGNVSDRDIQILQSALARLETERDPARMVEDINFIKREYNRIVRYAQQDAARANARLEQRARPRASFPGTAPSGAAPASADEPSLDDLLNQYAPPTQ